ncbi:PKD domain-containing protein [Mucilaginibacter sp. R-33]|uniref:PKD domain-containing protein n=1 Tax=Mucilaginibacter sp. R-33 TaxID=3416711 RepID=UPI003CECA39E
MKSSRFATAFFCVLFCMVFRQDVRGQLTSSLGRDFWVAFPTHVPDFDAQLNTLPAQLSIFITGEKDSRGQIVAGNFSATFHVTAHQVTEIKVPREKAYIDEGEAGQVLHNRAVHVSVDPDMPKVTVYAHIFAGQRSAATLVLPQEALGSSYFSMNYPEHDTEGKNYITVVAASPNTTVFFRRGPNILAIAQLTDVNDVYEYMSAEDLSGVSVTTDPGSGDCQRFAAFSGSTGVYISPAGCNPHSLDPLYQQCLPTESWGKEYGFIPFSTASRDIAAPVRTAGQLLRIVAGSPYTEISIDGQHVASLGPGEFYTTPQPLNKPAHISANNPVMVAQFALSQSCSNTDGSNKGYSDPDMVLLNPISFSIKDITIYSSGREKISEQYVNVLLTSAAVSSFKVNGRAPTGQFRPMPTLPGYSYLQLLLPQNMGGTFRLTATEGFNAIAYGFGNVESYSYSAGTNLGARYQLQAYRISTGEKIDSACADDDDYQFRLTLAFKSPEISWVTDGYGLALGNADPIYGEQNGAQTFTYIMSKPLTYNQPGEHKSVITADYPDGHHNCGLDRDIFNESFRVIALPDVTFKQSKDDCGLGVQFTDQTPAQGTGSKWMWDFGDPQSNQQNTSATPSPFHQYGAPGKYEVSLTVTNASGCQAVKKQMLEIGPTFTPDFKWSAGSCEGHPVQFSDQSAAGLNFVTSKRTWDFGDGTTITSTAADIKHTYKQPGAYLVQLTLTGNSGCMSGPLSKTININARPKVNFLLPEVCTADAAAKFKADVPAENNIGGTLSFAWSFSDQNASPANPNTAFTSIASHRFTAAGKYLIVLTVSSSTGCDTTISRELTVNSSDPLAALEFNGNGAFCSGTPVILRNASTLSGPGEITRLVLFFDSTQFPEDSVVYTKPEYGQLIQHSYPENSGSSEQFYTVKCIAYSGRKCFSVVTKEITILPAPKLYFNEIQPVCSTAGTFKISQAGETQHLQAMNVFFTGNGVSADGFFNPSAAGIGRHIITYHFVSFGNCVQTISQVIQVQAPPEVTAPSSITLIAGNSIKLTPQYSGDGLTYHWRSNGQTVISENPFPIVSPLETTDFTVLISSGNCSTQATIHVDVISPPKPVNTFTPNGDGNNDLWLIDKLDSYPDAVVSIFNRYGALLYQSKGIYKPWDGKYNGLNVPSGTYYYIIKPGRGLKDQTGYLLLLR